MSAGFLARSGIGLGAPVASFGMLGGRVEQDAIFRPIANTCVLVSLAAVLVHAAVAPALAMDARLHAPWLTAELAPATGCSATCADPGWWARADVASCAAMEATLAGPPAHAMLASMPVVGAMISSAGQPIPATLAAITVDAQLAPVRLLVAAKVDRRGNC